MTFDWSHLVRLAQVNHGYFLNKRSCHEKTDRRLCLDNKFRSICANSAKIDDSGFFLKVGLHHSETNASVAITGVGGSASVNLDESGTGTLFGAGYDWKFSKDAFFRASITRYLRIGGESENKGTVYSLAVGMSF
jgi:hypothetical protein